MIYLIMPSVVKATHMSGSWSVEANQILNPLPSVIMLESTIVHAFSIFGDKICCTTERVFYPWSAHHRVVNILRSNR
jgi:hypothetical protein